MNGNEIPYTKGRYSIRDDFLDIILITIDERKIIYRPFLTLEVTKDSVMIYPMEIMRNVTWGACGNYDGDPSNDMFDEECIYKDPLLFGAAWLQQPEPLCNKSKSFLKMIADMESYRNSCPKRQDD